MNIVVKKRSIPLTLLLTLVLILGFSFLFIQQSKVNAVNTDDFEAGNIISDVIFTDYKSMSASQIQSFLNSKNSACLKNFQTLSLHDDNDDGLGDEPYGRGENRKVSAAQVIYQAAQLYRINPKVILATLEKEQGLITRADCPSWRYNTALGYACPDGEPCDTSAYGFTRQIDYGVWHFRGFFDDSYPIPPITPGDRTIAYNPSSSCGSKTIRIENRATAALYSYTPYQPNKATLAASPGQEVNCGAYGNLNFWRYYTSWFGSTYGYGLKATLYDTVTDKSGEYAKIGYSLETKPKSNVTIRFGVTSVSNARIVGNPEVTITPSNWNKPNSNTITVEGINNPSAGSAVYYTLKPIKITTSDSRYSSTPLSTLENVALTNLNSGAVGVYRLYSSTEAQHRFTASTSELASLVAAGWNNEGIRFYTCEGGGESIVRLKSSSSEETRLVVASSSEYKTLVGNGYTVDATAFPSSRYGSVPVYWRYDPDSGRSLYTTSASEGISAGFEDRGVAFQSCQPDNMPVFRMYRPSVGNHFFITSTNERNKAVRELGFRYENTGFYICDGGTISIYRLYKSSTKNHMLTPSSSERDRAVENHSFRDEGIKFKTCDDGSKDVFRLYRPSTGSHFLTVSEAEMNSAVANHGFRYEGRMFKAE